MQRPRKYNTTATPPLHAAASAASAGRAQFTTLALDRKLLSQQLPAANGVYRFKRGEDILYIGKSVNLKARVISHIESAKLNAKEAAIVHNSDTVDYFVTDTELKALLLEAKLIREIMPPYNVRWRDDKSYLYIKITWADEFPKILLSRREQDKKHRYYGPFPSTRVAQEIIRHIRRVFPFCTQPKITKQPCFYSKIGLCNPCPNTIAAMADTRERRELYKQYRRNVRRVMKVLEGNIDPIIKDLYSTMRVLSQKERFEEAIAVRGTIVKLEHFLQGHTLDKRGEEVFNQAEEGVQSLQKLLSKYYPELPEPRRMECFDISNTMQQQGTASMVVMTDGIINKKEYRKFKIKNPDLRSDVDMMKEVIRRRFIQKKWGKPDLLVVDGGKPQVRAARQVLAELEISVPLIGIAKNPDRLIVGSTDMTTLRLPARHPGFTLLRALRDESHRFAKKYHVYLRSKEAGV